MMHRSFLSTAAQIVSGRRRGRAASRHHLPHGAPGRRRVARGATPPQPQPVAARIGGAPPALASAASAPVARPWRVALFRPCRRAPPPLGTDRCPLGEVAPQTVVKRRASLGRDRKRAAVWERQPVAAAQRLDRRALAQPAPRLAPKRARRPLGHHPCPGPGREDRLGERLSHGGLRFAAERDTGNWRFSATFGQVSRCPAARGWTVGQCRDATECCACEGEAAGAGREPSAASGTAPGVSRPDASWDTPWDTPWDTLSP